MRWIVWVLAAFFYFYEYLLRVSPSTMVPELMAAFQISAGGIGVLGGSFFFAYAPMQLPVGVLMDRYGARKLLIFASVGCGVGSILFAIAKGLTLAYIGRICIGMAASFAFVAMVYVCSHWFESSKRALLVGLANSIAMLGGLAGEGPLSSAVDHFGWRRSMIYLGIVGFILALLFVPTLFKSPKESESLEKRVHKAPEAKSFTEGIKILLKSGQSWLNAILALLFYMATTALTGLWGIPFIQAVYGVSKVVAGYAISMIFIGWLAGGPIMGAISDRIGNRKKIISISSFLTTICLLPIIYWGAMPIEMLYVLIFLVGLFSGAQLLCFTFSTEINPSRVKGSAIACTNFIVAVGSAGVLPLIGWLLVQGRSLESAAVQADVYSRADYKMALTILPLFTFLAWILSLFLNESKRIREEKA